MNRQATFPVLKSYIGDNLKRIAMPLGGLGTGTVSLGGRGQLIDWEVANTPAKGFVPMTTGGSEDSTFFALRVQEGEQAPRVVCLEAPLPTEVYQGDMGSRAPNHGLPRFHGATFNAAYPLASVEFEHPDFPLQVRLEAFNPMVPGDVSASDLPVAVMRYVLSNTSDMHISATVCGCVPNFIGVGPHGGSKPQGEETFTGKGNVNRYDETHRVAGLRMEAPTLDVSHSRYGTMALTALKEAEQHISYRTQWNNHPWGGTILKFWQQLEAEGQLTDIQGPGQPVRPMASVAASSVIPADQSRAVTFLLTWHYPNRMTWTPGDDGFENTIGNHYTERFVDAFAAADYVATHLPELEQRTVRFVEAFCETDVPEVIREAALFNASTLRTQTCFRTPDGRFYGWEGCNTNAGCCHGSCTHVWNYENTLAFLFGELTRSMRDNEFDVMTNEQGAMSFRVGLPIHADRHLDLAAADGQMGTIVRMYRDWQLCGDDDWLRALWPGVKKAMQFCWEPGGWDADRDGVMEGCQHNTMDVEYLGPNPQMTGWYLAALRACQRMAGYLGDEAFAQMCHDLFESGSAKMDADLFNGEYYEHRVVPMDDMPVKLPQLVSHMGDATNQDPKFQLGKGCLVDQLVGQYMAHACDLGYLHDSENVRTALSNILRHNRRSNFNDHFNNMRSYVLGDETALLMASYPHGEMPEYPFPYFREVMTGFEYVVGVGLIYEGRNEEGLQVIQDIRDRYDGRKRSPFNEAECGHHYARAMAAWTAMLAWTGFHYSAVTGVMRFKASMKPVVWFWSTGDAFGTMQQQPKGDTTDVRLTVIEGEVRVDTIRLDGFDGQVNVSIDRPS